MNHHHNYTAMASASRVAEQELPHGVFVCRMGKTVIWELCGCALLFSALAIWSLVQQETWIGVFLMSLGIISWILFVYALTYRCHVTWESLTESAWILFFPKKKEVLWKQIRYRRIKRDRYGYIHCLRFYNERNKKLLSFDFGVVGAERIARIAKRKGVSKQK